MKTNWNKEEVNGLLDGLLKQYYLSKPWKFNTSTLNEYKKDNGLLPTLEVGWYWYEDVYSKKLCLVHRDGKNCYGFGGNNDE